MSAPAFRPGQRVRVRNLRKTGHVRTPAFIRGKTGIVDTFVGTFMNPEELAYGRSGGPAVHNYRVVFRQHDVWPDYAGSRDDRLFIEVYEHWLEPAAGASRGG
jgi:nitrile hydratase